MSAHRCSESQRWPEYDGHGIFLCYVCPSCRKEKLAAYRSDIFEQYECDEAIEPEPTVFGETVREMARR